MPGFWDSFINGVKNAVNTQVDGKGCTSLFDIVNFYFKYTGVKPKIKVTKEDIEKIHRLILIDDVGIIPVTLFDGVRDGVFAKYVLEPNSLFRQFLFRYGIDYGIAKELYLKYKKYWRSILIGPMAYPATTVKDILMRPVNYVGDLLGDVANGLFWPAIRKLLVPAGVVILFIYFFRYSLKKKF